MSSLTRWILRYSPLRPTALKGTSKSFTPATTAASGPTTATILPSDSRSAMPGVFPRSFPEAWEPGARLILSKLPSSRARASRPAARSTRPLTALPTTPCATSFPSPISSAAAPSPVLLRAVLVMRPLPGEPMSRKPSGSTARRTRSSSGSTAWAKAVRTCPSS